MKFIVEINGKKRRVSMGEYLFLKSDINDQILRRLESIENKLNEMNGCGGGSADKIAKEVGEAIAQRVTEIADEAERPKGETMDD